MSDQQLAYTWEIAGRKTLNPDAFIRMAAENGIPIEPIEPLIMIDCPRGAHAGKANMLFSKDDAAAIVALSGPQTITVRKFVQSVSMDGTMQWNEAEKYEFKGYYVLGIKDAFDVDANNVYVELADARYLYEQTFIRKRYNVRIKTSDYDAATLVGGTTPYTYQQALDNILSVLFSPPTLTIPVSYAAPENLIFDCSLADALDQLLTSLGCALIHDPLTGSYRIIDLTSAASLSDVMTAKSEGRLIEKTNAKAPAAIFPDKLNIRPAGIAVLSDSGVELPARTIPILIGTGIETVTIDDHQLICDTTRIQNAVNAWYGEQNFLLDETYQGILKQPPAEHLSNVRWYFEAGATRTRIQNKFTSKMPWPKQPTIARFTGSSLVVGTVLVQGVLATRSGSPPENKFPAWAGDLTTAYVDSGSLVSLSSGYTLVPFSTCKNPHGLNGEEGDTFVAVLDPDDEDGKFILLEVYSKKATIFFTFNADRECGGNFDKDAGTITAYDKEIAVTVKSWRHPGQGPEGFTDPVLKVQDTFLEAMLAKSGDVGYAQWNTAKQVWSIIKAQHYATDLKGVTTSDGGADPDHYWYCTPTAGFDGYFDHSATLTPVYVPIGWEYPGDNLEVFFKWNPQSCRFEAHQANYPCEG